MGKISKKAFASFVKEHRLKQSLTQEELAAILHVSGEVASKWERGIRFPNYEIIEDVADALGVTLQELYDGSKKPEQHIHINVSAIIIGIVTVTAVLGGIFIHKSNTGRKSESSSPAYKFEYGTYVCQEEELKPYILIEKDKLYKSFSMSASYIETYDYRLSGGIIYFGNEMIYVTGNNQLQYNGRIYELEYGVYYRAIAIKTDKGFFAYILGEGGNDFVEIINATEYEIPEEARTGDVIEFYANEIMESYPARATANNIIIRDDIKVDIDIDAVIKPLEELGYKVIFD